MSFLSQVAVIVLFQGVVVVLSFCDVEGELRLDYDQHEELKNQTEYYLIQVCILGQWSYVCNSGFSHQGVDNLVVLQQLQLQSQCSNGTTTFRLSVSDLSPGYLTQVACVGVEKRLIDCPRNEPLRDRRCGRKVQVNCSKNDISVGRECENGQLSMNETTNILYICVTGNWRTLCPRLWGPTEAKVACRQLNPGKTVIRGVVNSTATIYTIASDTSNQFGYYFHCSGKERKVTDCIVLGESDTSLCYDNMVATLQCDTGSVSSPVQLTLTAVSSSSVEANWTQPVSDPPQYRVGNHSISCTSRHGVYTTTHVSASMKESTHIHMVISGLTSKTSYNCCVSAHSELGISEQVCDTVVTTNMSLVQSSVTSLPWVGGFIIGAVMSTLTLLTVLAVVYLLKKKATFSRYFKTGRKRSVSLTHTNEVYSNYSNTLQPYDSNTPQPYEEAQLGQPEYSYATCASKSQVNTYDSVPPQLDSENDGFYGNPEQLPVVDNTALYSMCGDAQLQHNEEYSKLNRK